MSALFNDAIVTAFDKIGHSNGSAVSKHYTSDQLNNTDPMFLELYISHKLKQLADARYKRALADVEAAGFASQDGTAGTTTSMYSSNVVTLSRQIKTPASRLDGTKFRTQLTIAGVADAVIKKAEKEATVYNKPAVSFIVALTDA